MTMPGTPVGHVPSLAMQVDRDNVLEARRLLLAEADRLDDVVAGAREPLSHWNLCGGDPVSADAAAGFAARSMALLDHCQAHNADLRRAAAELAAVARTYGYTEEEIGTSLPLRAIGELGGATGLDAH